ncbi:thiamine pyrophosphate-dependent enzyme [Achromobacter aloeverae]
MRIAELITATLANFGVERIFSVPGESFLGLLDALHDEARIDLVTCRHEGSAGLAAVADAKLSGKTGVAAVSRGPGLFNASIALHVAEQEAIPLILLVGQVDLPNLDRGAVQEVDTRVSLNRVIKGSYRIAHPATAAEVLRKAFALATSGTPGAVIIELPEDALEYEAAQAAPFPAAVAADTLAEPAIDTFVSLLEGCERPLLLVGGQNRSDDFRHALARFAGKFGLPVVAANKQQDQFPNRHPNWAGQLGFFPSREHTALLGEADLIVALGTRLGDLSTLGFSYPRQAPPRQKLVHVHPDAAVLGARFETDLAVAADAGAFVRRMLDTAYTRALSSGWSSQISHARETLHYWRGESAPTADVLGHTVHACSRFLSDDGIVTTDSGNFASWVHRIYRLEPTNRLLGSACGAMGSGVPAALAAALRFPGRQVTAFCGDGGFLMNGNELATAVERDLDIKIVVSNNRSYGTIRTHQQRAYPGRVSGTDLHNPDFRALANAFGAQGLLVAHAHEAAAIVEQAYRHQGPVLIEVKCDPDYTVARSIEA